MIAASLPHAVTPAAVDDVGAAALVSISRGLWRKLVSSQRAPQGMKFGACRRWSRNEIVAWIDAGAPPLDDWRELWTERGAA